MDGLCGGDPGRTPTHFLHPAYISLNRVDQVTKFWQDFKTESLPSCTCPGTIAVRTATWRPIGTMDQTSKVMVSDVSCEWAEWSCNNWLQRFWVSQLHHVPYLKADLSFLVSLTFGHCNIHQLSIFIARNATATTDLIVKQLLCSSAVSDFFETFYGSSSTDYAEYQCATCLQCPWISPAESECQDFKWKYFLFGCE